MPDYLGWAALSARRLASHCNVNPIGRGPTCRYTPSRGGSKRGPKGFIRGFSTKPVLDTGKSPTPKFALVNATANASAAFFHASHGCSGPFWEPGFPSRYNTETPSLIWRAFDRSSVIREGFQPRADNASDTWNAKLLASRSSEAACINTLVPEKTSSPANHSFALAGPSTPSIPAFLGARTACRARFSACSSAARSFAAAASRAISFARSSEALALLYRLATCSSKSWSRTRVPVHKSATPIMVITAPIAERRQPHV